MDANGIMITASAAAALGLGASLGLKLAPAFIKSRRELAVLNETGVLEDAAPARQPAIEVSGRRRETSIVGLYRDALRHDDGSFTRAYHVELEPSIFSDDLVLERRYDALARLLAARKPVGAVIQFRLSTDLDPGLALRSHAVARDPFDIHPLAALLHDQGLQTYVELTDVGNFRRSALTCWARVPSPLKDSADDFFLPNLKREFKNQGLVGLPRALAASWKASSRRQIALRTIDNEEAAFAEAEKTFRLIERESALRFTRLKREELWEAVYLGHRQNATSVPTIPHDGVDVRHYLCGETIEASGVYVMHGNCPAAIVSMFTPPQPFISADALRLLSVNGTLNFRHTLISEFIYPDQSKAVKRLDRRIRQVMRSAQSLSGRQRLSPEASVALQDLSGIRHDLAGGREAIAQVRFYVVIYGEPARTRSELTLSLENLDRYCEQIIAEIRKINGADADREEPAALNALYPKALVGEAGSRSNSREVTETASSLAPLIPTESEWGGAPRPHTLFSLPTGKLIGIDLFDRQLVSSPLALALAAPRGGKSVLLGRFINDVLATKARARVRAVDFGESFGPLVDVLDGRHLRFEAGTDRTINVWDYDGLERGELPDEVQVAFVVGDLMQLARVPADDTLAEDILTTLAGEVYRNETPRNRPGLPKHEPRLSHLVDYLATWPFKGAAAERAEALKLALGQFCGHSFLDAPTHPDFAGDSALDVYELDSLEHFPERVRESLAYRAASRVLRVIGQLNEDGTRSPTLLVFDEVWKIKDKYPRILDVIRRGARTGGKENVVTILATQAYEDLSSLPDIAKTAGVKIIGKQVGDYAKLVEDSGLAPQAAASRSQALGAIAGGYAMSKQMAEAQREATLGLLEQSRRQQVTGLSADRSFGQLQTKISMDREEYDLRISQDERNTSTIANRSLDTLEHGAGAIAGIAGESTPVLPAFRDGVRAITAPARAYNEITISNTAYDARVENLRRARGEHVEVYELTSQMRINAAERYAIEAGKIAYTQAATTISAARAQRDLAAGGVERGYRHQAQGIDSAYRLNLEANQLNFAGAMKAAELMQASGMKAVKLEQMSQIVTTLSRDMARRAELALTMRY